MMVGHRTRSTGKSTLNRLELSVTKKIGRDEAAFPSAGTAADPDATDDPIHGLGGYMG